MRIAVFGAGGVGGYFGGQLAKAGLEVVFIARGAHLQAIRQNGLFIKSAKGDFCIQPARAEEDPSVVGPVDIALLGVKAWQVSEAARAMRPMIGPDTVVIPLENGVEAPSQLSEVLGSEHVAGGLCRISSQVGEPGHIQHIGMEPSIAFNWFDHHPDPRLDALCTAFLSQGVKAEIPFDIQVAMWLKFIFIASISGVGSLTRAPVGVQRSLPETRQLLETTLNEVVAVGRARGVALKESVEQDTLRFIDSIPPATVASMQRDIIAGRPSELEYQNGTVVRFGREYGVPTPANEFIYASLLPLEERARGRITF